MLFCLREYSVPFKNEHFITFSGYFWVCRVPYCHARKHLALCSFRGTIGGAYKDKDV